MKRSAAVLALLLAPAFALADPPAEAPGAPEWSVGAGLLGFGIGTTSAAAQLAGGNTTTTLPVGVGLSLERAAGARRWLVLGANVRGYRTRGDEQQGSFTVTRDDLVAVAISGGLRQVLTPAGAPVEVSALWLGEVGVGHHRLDVDSGGTTTQRQDLQWLGASAGLAVARELLPNLSIRLSTPVVRVEWAHSSRGVEGQPRAAGSSVGLSAAFSPQLELRLAF